jgi:hypothetical protein
LTRRLANRRASPNFRVLCERLFEPSKVSLELLNTLRTGLRRLLQAFYIAISDAISFKFWQLLMAFLVGVTPFFKSLSASLA